MKKAQLHEFVDLLVGTLHQSVGMSSPVHAVTIAMGITTQTLMILTGMEMVEMLAEEGWFVAVTAVVEELKDLVITYPQVVSSEVTNHSTEVRVEVSSPILFEFR